MNLNQKQKDYIMSVGLDAADTEEIARLGDEQKSVVDQVYEYLQAHPIPEHMRCKESEIDYDQDYIDAINAMTINELADVVKEEGMSLDTKDGGLGVHPAYGRLVKLCERQKNLRSQGIAADNDDNSWYPHD